MISLGLFRAVSYNLMECEYRGKQMGFIAQEVERVFPGLVVTRVDGNKGVKYSRFVPLLVEAVREIGRENDRQS